MSLTRGFLIGLCTVALMPAQSAPKHLTARELFYAAAQMAPSHEMAIARPPSRPPTRPARTPAKAPETARVEKPTPAKTPETPVTAPAPTTSTSATSAPIVRASLQTAPMPTTGETPLGLRYTILKINADNSTTEVPADTVFHSGDRIRFAIEPNSTGYLYIINQGSSGTWKPMFPSPEIEDGNNKVEGFHPYTMPPNSRLAFDSNVGTENVFIVFSRQPEPDLEQLIYSLQGKRAVKAAEPAKAQETPAPIDKTLMMAANISNPLVDRLRNAYSRDLIVEKVDTSTPGDRKETAVYVVNPTGSHDSRVVADLHLEHQ